MSTLSRALSLVTVLVFPSVALTAVPAAAATPPFDLLTALRTAYQERGETVSFAGLTTMLDAPNVANAVTTTLDQLGHREEVLANASSAVQGFGVKPATWEEQRRTTFSVTQPFGASIRLGRDQCIQLLSVGPQYPVAPEQSWTELAPDRYEYVQQATTTSPASTVRVPAGSTYRYEDWIDRVLTESTVISTARLSGDLILRNHGRTFAVPVGQALAWMRTAGDTRVPSSFVVDGAHIITSATLSFSGITSIARAVRITDITPVPMGEARSLRDGTLTPRSSTTSTTTTAPFTPPPRTTPFSVAGTPAGVAPEWQRIPLTASSRVLTEEPIVGNISVSAVAGPARFTANAAAVAADRRLVVFVGPTVLAESFRDDLTGMTRLSTAPNGDVVFEHADGLGQIGLVAGSFGSARTDLHKATVLGGAPAPGTKFALGETSLTIDVVPGSDPYRLEINGKSIEPRIPDEGAIEHRFGPSYGSVSFTFPAVTRGDHLVVSRLSAANMGNRVTVFEASVM